jgi:crossover junction endodeoxyribonuclease RusA
MPEPFFRGTLPVPPGINASHRPGGKHGRTVHTKEAKSFKRDAAWMLKSAMVKWDVVEAIKQAKKKRKQIPLEMTIFFFYESRWRKDIDAGIKATIDAAFEHMNLKDNIVIDLHVKKQADKEHPRTEVEISIVEE